MSFRVAIVDDRFDAYDEEREILGPIATLQFVKSTDERELTELLTDVDAVIVNLAPIRRPVIEAMQRCRVICRYGIGFDTVDVEAATERGIWVARVPDYGIEDVSDHALGLFLACVRKIPFSDRRVRAGEWNFPRNRPSYRIKGKIFGLLGYGAIARALHRKLTGLGLAQVLAYDPYVEDGQVRAGGAEPATIEEILTQSDFVSIHAPRTPETEGVIDARRLEMMKSTAVLVNTARGGIIDEAALAIALSAGTISYAALDVFDEEPLPASSPLRTLDNIILSDHHAYYSEESLVELKTKASISVRSVLEGGPPTFPLNHPGSAPA